MKNKKGFTLIELLATFTILSIIMLIAIPSTLSILDKNKRESFISDAKRFVALAESEIRNNDKLDTQYGGVIVFKLSDFNDGTFETDPDGEKYNMTDSYVVVHKKGNASNYQLDYYVQLYGKKRGIPLTRNGAIEKNTIIESPVATNVNTTIKNAIGSTPTEIVYAE